MPPVHPASDDASQLVPSRQYLVILMVLMCAGALSSATGTIVAPVFPEVLDQLQIEAQWAGLLVSTHTLTTALASPVLGLLANRLGGRWVLLVSLVSYGVFGTLGAFSQGAGMLLLSRALVGAASGGIAAGSIGLLSNLYDSEARSRMMGYAASVLSTATVIFPLLGGAVGLYGWRWSFVLYGLGLPVALASLLLPRRLKRASAVDLSQTKGIRQTLLQPNVMLLCLALAVVSAIFYIVVVYVPIYLKAEIGASTWLNGVVLAARAVGAAVISAVGASRLAKAVGANRAIALGFLLMALSLATIPHLTSPAAILLAALLFGLGFGIVMPTFYSALADLSPAAVRSGVLAIGTGCASLGQFFSPVCFGPIWQAAGIGVFYAGAGTALLVGLLAGLRRQR
ncbi:MAG: MFS transporter [Leptolyngbya sp. SIO4C1]|nr:MFS transporter [Leptolyngbya sp. SIO4C1]